MRAEHDRISPEPTSGGDVAPGPLVVSAADPRYFTVASDERKAVYLTGSHIWNNLHDGMGPGTACAGTPERFDFGAYLDLLRERGHNFIRLWRWELFRSRVTQRSTDSSQGSPAGSLGIGRAWRLT